MPLPTRTAAKKAKPAPKLTKLQRRRVRELMSDEGQTRAEAVAWVTAFEPDEGIEANALVTGRGAL